MTPYHFLRRTAVLIIVLLAAVHALRAQEVKSVGNAYVRANVSTLESSGRFWITAGPALGNYRFLFGNAFIATSNIVFRITQSGTDTYFSNIPFSFPYRPQIPGGGEIDYKPYDSIYASNDTIAVMWNDMLGVNVTMRFIPEHPLAAYQNGADMLVEFSYTQPGTPATKLGILMMLDTYNSQAGGIDGVSTITTDLEHFPIGSGGGVRLRDSLPQFYHIGSARYDDPLNTVMGVHRLRGFSHDGRQLTPPGYFAVGEWEDLMRDVAWDPDTARLRTTPIGDCATLVRWSGLAGNGVVRTAFGSSDREGNNFFTCRDSNVFVVMRTVRSVEQTEQGGVYSPPFFNVEAWVANLRTSAVDSMTIVLDQPAHADGLIIEQTTPAVQTAAFGPREVRHFRWQLSIPADAGVVNADVPLGLRYALGAAQPGPFLDVCAPHVSIRGIPNPGHDSVAPEVDRHAQTLHSWTFSAFDRHDQYIHDSGLDTIRVVESGTFNMRLNRSGYLRCDTTAIATLQAEVIDTNRPAHLLMVVYDCAGNASIDSADFRPPPRDTAAPVLVRVDSTFGQWTVKSVDIHSGYLHDSGIDSIRVDAAATINARLLVPSFSRCDTTVSIVYSVDVIDTTKPARLVVIVSDCRGNLTRDTFSFTPHPSGVDVPGALPGAALTIVDIRPQPFVAGADAACDLFVRNVGAGGATAELVAADGSVVRTWLIAAGAERVPLTFADRLAAGLYWVRLRDAHGTVSRKFIIMR